MNDNYGSVDSAIMQILEIRTEVSIDDAIDDRVRIGLNRETYFKTGGDMVDVIENDINDLLRDIW